MGLRLLAFVLLSASIHGSAFVVLGRKAKDIPARTFEPNHPPLSGDTLDVETHPPADPEPWSPIQATAKAATAVHAGASPVHRVAAAAASPAASPPPAQFGAVGERFATDLATTFTRAFPQAASADPIWSAVAFGGAGRTEVTLVLDDAGHLVDSEIGGSPSAALRRSVERTIALIAPRAFTARGAMTRLGVTAHVSRDDVHDGLHGDVFALSAGSFSGVTGTAFFALPAAAGTGRRVDVEVRLLP